MYILEMTLKGNPGSLTVQKKEEADANAAYQQLTAAMQSAATADQLLEITCDFQPGKKISVFGSSICAVQVYEKSSGGTPGRTAGFFAA
ncbi:MAG: hypothetical protein RLZZ511_25 [Cyanobacteriota bacterium]|jgi:hypothetical protein